MGKVNFEEIKIVGKDCPVFRASYAHVFKPKGFNGGEEKYSITMLFPKDVDLKQLKRAAFNAATAKWGDKTKWPKRLKFPFRDGDQDFPDSPGYAGHIFVRASSKEKPQIVDQKRNPILDDENGRAAFYSGCYAKASLVAFAYDVSGNVGVSFALLSLQKVRDGEQLGGRRNAEDEFDELEDSSEDMANYGNENSEDAMGF